MNFECGPGWFKANGCRAETEEGEVHFFKFRPDGSFKLVVRKRKKASEPLYTMCVDERWDID